MDEAVEPLELEREMDRSPLGPILTRLSRIPKVRRVCLKIALSIERGAFYSKTAREIMSTRYGVMIGAYSYGSCFRPGQLPPRVTIGRYVSFADGVSVLQRNHPMDRVSTHPFFFNARLGYVEKDLMSFGSLVIGHDAWIGERAIFTPGCRRIGIGGIVGAGAVVTKDVPAFAIVGGNPARILRFRFSESVQREVLASRWWLQPIHECVKSLDWMTAPLIARDESAAATGVIKNPAKSQDKP